jgi:hypothetical protein
MRIRTLHSQIETIHHKPWQTYLLLGSIIWTLALVFDVGVLRAVFGQVEIMVSGVQGLVLLGIQGVLIGFAAEFLHEQDDTYAKTLSDQFQSKDHILLVRVGFMTAISAIVTQIVPPLLEGITEYLVIQTAGATLLLGILLVHRGSRNWNPLTEWPALLAGLLLAVTPTIT